MDHESSSTTTQSINSYKVSLLLIFCAIAALMIFLVSTENFVFGSTRGNWVYPYFKRTAPLLLLKPIIVFILLGLSIFIGNKLIPFYEKTALVICFLITFFMQILLHSIYPISLEKMVQSKGANGFYSVAMDYSALEVLTQYHTLVSTFPLHARANLPGKILFYELLKLLTPSPEIMGWMIILLSTSGAFLLYSICDKLFCNKKAAFYAFILYTLIPCRLFFFPILNTVTPVFILLCLYLFLIYIERKNSLFLWLLACVLFLLILFEPLPLVTGVVFVGILLDALAEKRLLMRDLLKVLIIPLLALFCLYILFSILFSFDIIRGFQFVLDDAVEFNIKVQRGYRVWIGENLKEFFYSGGTPVILIFMYWVLQFFVEWRTFKYNAARWSMENIFVLSLLTTFGVVVLFGINRGEISRLWIFMAVFFQIPTSLFIAKIRNSSVLFFIVASTIVVQSIIALQRVGFVLP